MSAWNRPVSDDDDYDDDCDDDYESMDQQQPQLDGVKAVKVRPQEVHSMPCVCCKATDVHPIELSAPVNISDRYICIQTEGQEGTA
jgi:hypothetical protein